ncbi:MAG: tetratricopeptide repeat protein, partial [Cyclobacteriaceae bacterium]
MPERGKVKQAFISGCLACVVFFADAQSLKDHLAKGDRFYQRKDYENALKSYEEALALDANDPLTNFKAGIAYLNEGNFSQAVARLEKAHQLKADVDPDIDYHLGIAYQEDHQYAKARGHFETFKVRNKKLAGVANQKILECILGDSLMGIPAKAQIQPMTAPINTPFAEFSPLITKDGNTLIFTSNRSTDNYQVKSATNFGDVYISRKN